MRRASLGRFAAPVVDSNHNDGQVGLRKLGQPGKIMTNGWFPRQHHRATIEGQTNAVEI